MAERIEGKPIASPEDTLTIALSLAKLGWYVFPVKLVPVFDADGNKVGTDKRPLVRWLEGASRDLEQIATWWGSEFPGAWVGVHAERSGIVTADLDLSKPWPDNHPDPELRGREKGDGRDNLRAAGFVLPKTPIRYKTRSGGRHYIYAAPEGRTLTIARDVPVPSVDVRAGNGLMVYYGPAVVGPVTLPPAPDWLLLDRQSSGTGAGRAADGDIEHLMSRAVEGEPGKALRKLLKKTDWEQLAHDDMLQVVAELVKAAGLPGGRTALTQARAAYIKGRERDRPRDWDNAVKGSIGKLGVPPATLALTKAERKHIAHRNAPEAQEAKELQRKKEYRVKKLDERADASVPDIGNRDLTDAALAEEVSHELDGSWANVGGVGLLRYSGIVWEPVDEALLIERVRRLVRNIRAEETRAAILRGDKKREDEARGIESRNRIVAIARLAAGMMLERAPQLDADPDVINCPNGVVDLRTGKMRERVPGDYFTKVTGAEYHPRAESADWALALKALPKLTRRWLQVRFGQAATGRIAQDKGIPFLIGGGDNGKSVVVGGIRNALGDYAVTAPERLLLGSDNDHPTDIMTLEGARLAVFEELPRGGRLNAQRIKLLSGTNKLSGRRMRMDFREFDATHTLAGATNHLPVITDVDDAIWERVAPVPFPYKFVDRKPRKGTNERRGDPGLRDRLADVADPAVLAWLVEGAVESYKGVPAKPPAVLDALEDWRGEADPVLGFVRDHLEFDEHTAVVATDLYGEFGRYLEGRGQQVWSDQLIATSFAGHSSLPGVVKRQVVFGLKLGLSRPGFALKAVPDRPMAWVGVRFKGTAPVKSEAEQDADAFADLAKRAKR